jgi:1,4-dihydroxy-6-naphthoate synthase
MKRSARQTRQAIRLGISTCPNDTFAFHALMSGEVESPEIDFEIELADVQELNERMLEGGFDLAKVSFAAALAMAERVEVLPTGAALGFGVGPLLLASPRRRDREPGSVPRVLCPGEWTTATLLWRLFHPEPVHLGQRVFSEIMPALERGEADLGVCIHEGRFTWRESGLEKIEDLGETWEESTGTALPLGGIVARRDLPSPVTAEAIRVIRKSIRWGLAHRERCLVTMRRHAQEQTDRVLLQHVELYVNDSTVTLGPEGRRALTALSEAARERGLLPPQDPPLRIAEASC